MTVDSHELEARRRVPDTVAAYLATFVHFASPVAIVYYPGRIGPGAMLVALVAVALASGPSRLVGSAVAAATTWWLVGMTIAIALDRPVF